MESEFCGMIEVGMCMRLEKQLTHKVCWFEHFNHPDTALVSLSSRHGSRILPCYIASCVGLYVVLFSSFYNEFFRD